MRGTVWHSSHRPFSMSVSLLPSSIRFDPQRLRQTRERRGFTREALAARAGVSVSTLQRAERGEAIQPESAAFVAQALATPLPELLEPSEPPRRPAHPDPQLIDRDRECNSLRQALLRAEQRQPALVLISGEAGVGKTALLKKAFAEASAIEACVMCGEGSQFERTRFAFDPFVVAMREHMPLFRDVLKAREYNALTSFVERRSNVDQGSDLVRRARMFDLVQDALLVLGRQRLVVFGVDDLQWVDIDSLELFASLARRLDGPGAQGSVQMVLLATVRTIDPVGTVAGSADDSKSIPTEVLHEALDRVERLSGAHRLKVTGLSQRGVGGLIKRLGIERPAAQLVDTIHQGTSGNPLFVKNIVDELRVGNELFDQAGSTHAWIRPEELRPGHFVDAITKRALGLSAQCRELLVWAAFLGPKIDAERLAELLGRPLADVWQSLGTGLNEGFLDVGRSHHAFRHPLIRATFYQLTLRSPTPMTARIRHRRIAEQLVALGLRSDAECAEIAHHLLRAGSEAPAALALEFCERQADRDFDACAWMNAAKFYEAAIAAGERLGAVASRMAALHLRAGLSHNYAFETGVSQAHYSASIALSRATSDEAGAARALSRLTRLSDNVGERSDAQIRRRRALEVLAERLQDDTTQHQLVTDILDVLAICAFSDGDMQRALEFSARGDTIAAMHNNELLRAHLATVTATALMEECRLQEAHDRWVLGLTYARRSGDLATEARQLQRFPHTLFAKGELDEALSVAAKAEELSERTGNRGEVSLAYATQVAVAAVRGDVVEAHRRMQLTLECIERSRYVWSGVNAYLAWAYAQALTGDWAGALATTQKFAEPGVLFTLPDGTSGLERLSGRFCSLIAAYLPRAETTDFLPISAGAAVAASPKLAGTVRLRDLAYLCARIQLAASLQRPPLGQGLGDSMQAAVDSGVVFTPGWPFFMPRVLGLARMLDGRLDLAAPQLSHACARARDLGIVPELVHTRLDYARCLLLLGDSTLAREQFRLAQDTWSSNSLELSHLRSLEYVVRSALEDSGES